MSPIHKCDPATAERGNFCLLRFRPRPVRSSLGDLATPGSPGVAMSTPSLARTPAQHESTRGKAPRLKPSSSASLQAAGLQGHATTPGERCCA
ncbi:hypothetical protein MTO96_019846 [Rhipicephalus appendiculatus]